WQARPLLDEALRRSLYATVGQTLQGIERHGTPVGAAMKRARIQAQGVVTRQVMNAGRNSTIATTERDPRALGAVYVTREDANVCSWRSEEHTSELQSRENLVCRLLLEKKK